MAVLRGTRMAQLAAGIVPDPGFVDATVRAFVEEVTLASQATTDTIEVARLPKGAVPLYGIITTDTSLGSATVAIGVTGATGKYRAAATFTTTNTPTLFGVGAVVGVPLEDEETVFITTATAALPSSGRLVVAIYYAFN
jgi:hypothetical protein